MSIGAHIMVPEVLFTAKVYTTEITEITLNVAFSIRNPELMMHKIKK
jgi:hypothetical protein